MFEQHDDTPEHAGQEDLSSHGLAARREYSHVRPEYEELATKVASILREAIRRRSLHPHSITFRAKDLDSFEEKAAKPDPDEPTKPNYPNPLSDIQDMAGVRVTTYFLSDVDVVDAIINEEFEILQRTDKSEALIKEDRFGYQSVHFIVRLKAPRTQLTEYKGIASRVCEVQVRTILQHTWAEIEHDIRYKSKVDIPPDIRRRFLNLAGLLEIADREFETIQREDERLRQEAEEKIAADNPRGVPITGPNLKLFLDKHMNPDARVSSWLYTFVARIAVAMGFDTLEQLIPAIESFDEQFASEHQWKSRPSPPSVLECMLFQYAPDRYLETHPWAKDEWFQGQFGEFARKLEAARGAA